MVRLLHPIGMYRSVEIVWYPSFAFHPECIHLYHKSDIPDGMSNDLALCFNRAIIPTGLKYIVVWDLQIQNNLSLSYYAASSLFGLPDFKRLFCLNHRTIFTNPFDSDYVASCIIRCCERDNQFILPVALDKWFP